MFDSGNWIWGTAKPLSKMSARNGQIFQVDVNTSNIVDPEEVGNFLLTKIQEEHPEIKVTAMHVSDNSIQFQFIASPSTLGFQPRCVNLNPTQQGALIGILVWLPLILALVGVALVGINIWQVVTAVPTWAWVLLGLGIVLLKFGPDLLKLFTGKLPEKYQPVTVIPTSTSGTMPTPLYYTV